MTFNLYDIPAGHLSFTLRPVTIYQSEVLYYTFRVATKETLITLPKGLYSS